MSTFALAMGAVGLVLGPFANALVASTPDRSGGGRRAFTCASCGGADRRVHLPWFRCRYCHARPSLVERAMPIVMALTFAAVGAAVGPSLVIVPMLVGVAALVTLSAIDIERYRLPDRLLFPSLGVVTLLIVAVSLIEGVGRHVWVGVAAGLIYFVLLLVPNLISPAGLAFGDVKLALLLGLLLGWTRPSIAEGLVLVVYALLLGMVLGIVSGLGVGIGRRVFGPDFLADPDVPVAERDQVVSVFRTAFPFGPALSLAAVIVMLASSAVLETPGLL